MKNFQRNLFVLLALALCGTCAYQWYVQAAQMQQVERLNQIIFAKSTDIQGFTNSIKSMDSEISQLHDRVIQLKQTIVSNEAWALDERREVARLRSAGDIVSNQLQQYAGEVEILTNKLQQAYDGERMLVGQRDGFAQRLNNSITARNTLTSNYNNLVERINKLQAAPPPAK